jgi:hypothetical protein
MLAILRANERIAFFGVHCGLFLIGVSKQETLEHIQTTSVSPWIVCSTFARRCFAF